MDESLELETALYHERKIFLQDRIEVFFTQWLTPFLQSEDTLPARRRTILMATRPHYKYYLRIISYFGNSQLFRTTSCNQMMLIDVRQYQYMNCIFGELTNVCVIVGEH